MENWLVSSLIAFLLFGLWGFFPKLAVGTISPASAIVYGVAGTIVVALVAMKITGFRPDVHPKGILFAVLTGVTGMLGTLFFFYAVKNGKVSVVACLTALYPVITILLARIFLHETLSPRQMLAMAMALTSIILFAS
ncbi:MAG: EamA family transporter [Proteobacteria bacterium]|nr:EamA family transporter [Desulfobulbaceae bacterium]MBU4153231.1 EamA family transporter [Pseudomonadota bacterium]